MLHTHSKSVFPNIFSHVKQSDSKSTEKDEGNGITGRGEEMITLTIKIWTMVKDGDYFRDKSSHSKLQRQTKWEKIPY